MSNMDCSTERQQHHIRLDSAISEIDAISSRIEDLIDLIGGTMNEACPSPTTPECEPVTTLVYVLEHGPDRIRGKLNRAHESINRLNDLLF